MASFTLKTPDRFPAGTLVTVYPASNFSPLAPPTGAPVGSSTTSGTTDSTGAVTFTGLTEGLEYYAYALVNSQNRYIPFDINNDLGREPMFGAITTGQVPVWNHATDRFDGTDQTALSVELGVLLAPLPTGLTSTDHSNLADWMAELVASNRVGQLREGDYVVDTSVQHFDDPIMIRGLGPLSRIVTNQNNIFLFYVEDADNVILDDVTLVGPIVDASGTRNNSQCLARFVGCNGVRTKNLTVMGSAGSGLIHRGGTDCHHIAPRVDLTLSDGFGIYSDITYGACEDISSEGAKVSRTGDDALSVVGYQAHNYALNKGCQHVGFHVKDSGAAGLHLTGAIDCNMGPGIIDGTATGGIHYQQDTGNLCTGTQKSTGHDIKVRRVGSSSFNPQSHGINPFGLVIGPGTNDVSHPELACSYNEFMDIEIDGCLDRGVVVRGLYNRVLKRITARNCAGTGFDLGDATYFQWEGFTAETCGKHGFQVGGTSGSPHPVSGGDARGWKAINNNTSGDTVSDNFNIDRATDCAFGDMSSIDDRGTPLIHRHYEVGSSCVGVIDKRNWRDNGNGKTSSFATVGVMRESPRPTTSGLPTTTVYVAGQEAVDTDWSEDFIYDGSVWVPKSRWLRGAPNGAFFETIARMDGALGNVALLTSGTLLLSPVDKIPKKALTGVRIWSGSTAAVAITHAWVALLDSARNMLKLGDDMGAITWAANTRQPFTLNGGSTWTPSQTYVGGYVALLVTATTTVPSLRGGGATVINDTPVPGGNSVTGLTDPSSLTTWIGSNGNPTAPSGATAGSHFYGWAY